jgi:hypothetical protein
VHAPNEEENNDSKDSFYEEFERVFGNFPNYHTKIRYFKEKLGRKDILKPTIGNGCLHQGSNDNGKLCTSKNPLVKSTMFPHRHIHKYTWSSPD